MFIIILTKRGRGVELGKREKTPASDQRGT